MTDSGIATFLSRQGQTIIKLARLLLTLEPGDELERIHEYATRFGVGVGTVQSALKFIQDAGAVQLRTKGHLGTTIDQIDYRLLWSITGQEYLVGTMPLPYSRRYEGLATGLHETFKQAQMGLNLMYSRGSKTRLHTLSCGQCDFVVLSRFAFDKAVENGMEVEAVVDFGAETYVGQHVLLLRDHSANQIEDGMRVGLDPQSLDQAELTRQACPGKVVRFVETSYMHLANALLRGDIDAAVWNGDDFATPASRFKAVPLTFLDDTTCLAGNTEAIITIDKSQHHLRFLLRSVIDAALVRKVQMQVMEGRILPSY